MQEQHNTASRQTSTSDQPVPRASDLTLEQRALLEAKLLGGKGGFAADEPSGSTLEKGALSFAQESLWFLDQYEPNSSLYNVPHVLRLKGLLDVSALQKGIEYVVNRHESLRSRFVSREGKPVQEVVPNVTVPLPVIDLSSLSSGDREKEARHRIDEESARPFDLSIAPLFRAGLIRLGPEEHILMLTMHHIISDLASFQVFYKELSAAYEACSNGGIPQMSPRVLQFPEYAARQRQQAIGKRYKEQLAYWKKQLAGERPVIELPQSRPRPRVLSFAGRRRRIELPVHIRDGARELSRRQNTTMFVTLMAAFQALLHRYSGQTDIIVGSPMSGRMDAQTEEMIGFLINTLPIRANLGGDPSFIEVMERVKWAVLGALANQEAPVEKLIDDLKIARNGARNPLFQTVFQFVPDSALALKLNGICVEPLEIELGTSKFEMTVTLADSPAGLVGDIEYSTDLFDEKDIERIFRHFQTLLEGAIANPHQKISRLPLLPPEELATVTNLWNRTHGSYPRHATVNQLFEEQAANRPDSVALVFNDSSITYGELNRRANQLARRLRKHGIGPDTLVGFCVERSIEMVVGLIGILKAGGAYVTLDPNAPHERIAYMFEDTRAKVFVTTTRFRDLASPGTQVVCLDEAQAFANEEESNLPSIAGSESLAYVIYTSGSTGKPKGVLVPHRAIVRLVKETNYLPFTPDDVFLQFATISFDASTLELWGPLLNGGKLVIFPPQFESLEQLGTVIREKGVTTLWLTAGLFHEMVEQRIADLKSVRYLLAGGDVLSPAHVIKALKELPDTTLINGYGPTENTTFTCCFRIPRDWQGGRTVPIGSPISNTQVYILDDHLQPVPVGVAGELFAAGDGLAREYLNAAELTAGKFLPNPFSTEPGAKMYRTGDRVRWLPDGTIEFLGRRDTQVKIRGYRIELSEIETALAVHPAVQQCVVTAREDNTGTRQLVAYVVFKPDSPRDPAKLREFLAQRLPAYMAPSSFVALDSLPLNANGKVDRYRLPDPAGMLLTTATASAAMTADEEKVAQIWSEVLGVEVKRADDNFFELGGHSLLATRVISRVNIAFGGSLPLRALFEAPTVSALANLAASARDGEPAGNRPMIRRARRIRPQQPLSQKTL